MQSLFISLAVAATFAGGIALISSEALSHNTENERRRPAACNSIAGDAERAACKLCVANNNRHYHPRLNACHRDGTPGPKRND